MKPRFGGARRAGPGEWVRGRRREGEMREIERFFQSRMRYLESFREKRERERDEPSRFLSPRFSLVWADKSSRFPSQERVARSEIARGVFKEEWNRELRRSVEGKVEGGSLLGCLRS